MKISLPSFAALLLASSAALAAAPLTATTAVHTQPDEAAPTITILKAGTEPVASTDPLAVAPAGWMAVELPGPFEGYVKNNDILKSLEVRPGAPIHFEPKDSSGVLASMAAGDKVKITGLLGRWTQVSLDQKLTGYVRTGAEPATASTAPSPAPAESAAPRAAAPAAGSTTAGKPVPVVDAMPRLFEGKLVSTRSPFRPRRPFDWAIVDDAGKRIAFLDLSQLLQTEQIDSYADHTIVVHGTPKMTNEGKDLVITAETLRLK